MLETENVFKEFKKYLIEHKSEANSEEDMRRLMNEFMSSYNASISSGKKKSPESADDYVILAERAETKKEEIDYLKKALSLDPEHVDARLNLIGIEKADNKVEMIDELEKLLKREAERLEKKGYFENEKGNFYSILETRPYIRVKYELMNTFCSCSMMSAAIKEGEEIIALNKVDNLGARYVLMHLYALMEDEKKSLKLHKKYENCDDTMMLMPLVVLYFKLRQFDKAKEYLLRVQNINKDLKKFLRAMAVEDDDTSFFDEMSQYGYRPRTIEELGVELCENAFLFDRLSPFFEWAYLTVNKKNK